MLRCVVSRAGLWSSFPNGEVNPCSSAYLIFGRLFCSRVGPWIVVTRPGTLTLRTGALRLSSYDPCLTIGLDVFISRIIVSWARLNSSIFPRSEVKSRTCSNHILWCLGLARTYVW